MRSSAPARIPGPPAFFARPDVHANARGFAAVLAVTVLALVSLEARGGDAPDGHAGVPAAAVAPDWCRDPPPSGLQALARVDVGQPWFDVFRVRPGVFALFEPRQYEHVISYLIVGERRALLFDTGLGIARMRDAVRELTALPVTVLNSHTHFDHVGGNAEFDDVWNADTPFSRASAAGHLDDYARATLDSDRLCGPLPEEMETRVYALRPWRVSHRVSDGERIDLGGRVLEVLFTPGHAPDALCLLDREHGLLFTGDTYYPGPIYLFAPGTDLDAYAKSVSALAALAPQLTLLLPAHEVPVAQPSGLVALRDAVARVRAGTATAVEVDGLREFRFDGFSLLLAPQ